MNPRLAAMGAAIAFVEIPNGARLAPATESRPPRELSDEGVGGRLKRERRRKQLKKAWRRARRAE